MQLCFILGINTVQKFYNNENDPYSVQCAFIHGDVNTHRTHSDMSLKTKMTFCNRCLSTIPLMSIMIYILYCAF
jgi:hypothetical protein